jgi:hypothetical protein
VIAGATTRPDPSPTPFRTVLAGERPPGDLPFTGDGTLPGNDWTWLLSIAGLGAGVILAVAIRRALKGDE